MVLNNLKDLNSLWLLQGSYQSIFKVLSYQIFLVKMSFDLWIISWVNNRDSRLKNGSWPSHNILGQIQGHRVVDSDDLNDFYGGYFPDISLTWRVIQTYPCFWDTRYKHIFIFRIYFCGKIRDKSVTTKFLIMLFVIFKEILLLKDNKTKYFSLIWY